MRSHIGVAMVCMINATGVHEMAEQKVPKLSVLIPATEAPSTAQCSRQALNQTEIVESGYKVFLSGFEDLPNPIERIFRELFYGRRKCNL
uniref:Uncharacterized protein n=1 Tax=Panagrolaimus superbus TaxID=310955 RepID=A0A914XYS8_9BILA